MGLERRPASLVECASDGIVRISSESGSRLLWRIVPAQKPSRSGNPTMRLTPALVACTLFVLFDTATVNAQTKLTAPSAPPLSKPKTSMTKGRRSIPPPPPISSIRTPRSKRTATSGRFDAMRMPGRDPSGRIDMLGKPVNFYPVTHGVDQVKPNAQASAIKRSKRLDGNVNPSPPKPLK